jgi:hypothetical protein
MDGLIVNTAGIGAVRYAGALGAAPSGPAMG